MKALNTAIILAAGTGTRVGANIPKQFIEVMGKPILAWTLEIYQNNPAIDAIELVCHPDWVEQSRAIVEQYGITKLKWLTLGGSTFQESTMNGVFNLRGVLDEDDIVVLTFGVSPMTTNEVIQDSIRVAQLYGNGIASEDMVLCTCLKDPDDTTGEGSSVQPILRETIRGFSEPWSFRFGELCEAYETGLARGMLDELEPHTTSLYMALGKRVYFSRGTHNICKITYKQDLDTFEGWLLLKQKRAAEAGCHRQEEAQ